MTDPAAPPFPAFVLYRTTVFLVERPPPWPTFAIVTAHDPLGRPERPEENARRDRALFDALVARGEAPVRVTGCSPDRVHREPGYAFPADSAAAIEFGVRFAQNAVFLVVHDALLLLTCPPHPPVEECLGSFRARIVDDS